MKPVASNAAELPWQEQEAAELRAELLLMKTAGIIEVAVRNPSVAEYMAHWEGRAISAEARAASLEAMVGLIKSEAEAMIIPGDELSNDLVKYSFQRGVNRAARSIAAKIGGRNGEL